MRDAATLALSHCNRSFPDALYIQENQAESLGRERVTTKAVAAHSVRGKTDNKEKSLSCETKNVSIIY
jgi:hypothetical protein